MISDYLQDESGRGAVAYGISACVLGLIVVLVIGYVAGAVPPQ